MTPTRAESFAAARAVWLDRSAEVKRRATMLAEAEVAERVAFERMSALAGLCAVCFTVRGTMLDEPDGTVVCETCYERRNTIEGG